MYPSVITPNAIVSENNWAVSLVTQKRSQHTYIIFEGVKVDPIRYFARRAHLTGKGGIFNLTHTGKIDLSRKYTALEFRNNFGKKCPTWIVQKNKVHSLIKKIKNESEKPYPFIIFGNKSFISKKAEVYNIYDKVLKEVAKKDNYLFLRLYDSWKNGRKYTGMSEEKFNYLLAQYILQIGVETPGLLKEGVTYNFTTMMEILDDESVAQELIHQQNCFTWARNHLLSINLEVNESILSSRISRLITVTRLITRYSSDADGAHLVVREADLKEIFIKKDEKKLEHRVVTYKKNRDKRTEAKKEIDKMEKKDDFFFASMITSIGSAATSTAAGIGMSVAGVSFWPVVPVYLISMGAFFASVVLSADNSLKIKQLKKDEKIYEELSPKELSDLKARPCHRLKRKF